MWRSERAFAGSQRAQTRRLLLVRLSLKPACVPLYVRCIARLRARSLWRFRLVSGSGFPASVVARGLCLCAVVAAVHDAFAFALAMLRAAVLPNEDLFAGLVLPPPVHLRADDVVEGL